MNIPLRQNTIKMTIEERASNTVNEFNKMKEDQSTKIS